MKFRAGRECAQELDAGDELAPWREQFLIPRSGAGAECCYMAGNSLGLQPRSCRAAVERVLKDWGELGAGAWLSEQGAWVEYQNTLRARMARIVGAQPEEVSVMNSLTMNLHLLLASFYRPTASRSRLLIESKIFPSDSYALKSQIRLHGLDPAQAIIQIAPRTGESTVRTEDIEDLLAKEGESIALLLLPGVNYFSGEAFDMARITAAAHRHGCLAGFDLAHAAGNIELKLHEWNVDCAAWCCYKYLNAGPGSVAGFFVHRNHFDAALPRLEGWWGNDFANRFEMKPDFRPARGAEAWMLSSPPMLLMAALAASLEIFEQTGMPRLVKKSCELSAYLEYLLDSVPGGHFSIITPREPAARGCQLSVKVPERGRELLAALNTSGVVCDWREPDVIRLAPVPLYNSFQDAFRTAETVRKFFE